MGLTTLVAAAQDGQRSLYGSEASPAQAQQAGESRAEAQRKPERCCSTRFAFANFPASKIVLPTANPDRGLGVS